LDLVNKSSSEFVMIPLQKDDPLYQPGSPTNFMVVSRVVKDASGNPTNATTPFVDQNQTYTSHPSHQVFLRQYVLDATGRPVPDGKVLDGGACAPRGTGDPGHSICNSGNWAEVKAQAATKLGIRLTDQDVFDVPLVVTDPY